MRLVVGHLHSKVVGMFLEYILLLRFEMVATALFFSSLIPNALLQKYLEEYHIQICLRNNYIPNQEMLHHFEKLPSDYWQYLHILHMLDLKYWIQIKNILLSESHCQARWAIEAWVTPPHCKDFDTQNSKIADIRSLRNSIPIK